MLLLLLLLLTAANSVLYHRFNISTQCTFTLLVIPSVWNRHRLEAWRTRTRAPHKGRSQLPHTCTPTASTLSSHHGQRRCFSLPSLSSPCNRLLWPRTSIHFPSVHARRDAYTQEHTVKTTIARTTREAHHSPRPCTLHTEPRFEMLLKQRNTGDRVIDHQPTWHGCTIQGARWRGEDATRSARSGEAVNWTIAGWSPFTDL